MEQNNSFKTLLYIFIGLAVVIVGIVLWTKQLAKNKAENMVLGKAPVSEITINKDKTFPVGVMIVAKGNFEDNCTSIGDVTQSLSSNKFTIKVESKRPLDPKDCENIKTAFEKSFILEGVTGLKKGDYIVDVNGITGSFNLSIDNFISSEDPLK